MCRNMCWSHWVRDDLDTLSDLCSYLHATGIYVYKYLITVSNHSIVCAVPDFQRRHMKPFAWYAPGGY